MRENGFIRIEDRTKIAEVLRAHMLKPNEQRAPFLATIFDKPSNLIYEGARPISACTDHEGTTVFTLSNSDSNYRSPIGSVNLNDIQYIEVLPSKF
jgi:hypothetical protein